MGVLGKFFIAFDNQMAVYYPGQIMRGNVVIEVKEAFNMRGVRILLHGKAYVHWSEGSNKHRRHYSATEIYFNDDLVIVGKAPSESDQQELPVGTHTFPFQYQFPPVLPSSFESGIGYVRYLAKATIDRKWRIDPTTRRAFTIINLLNLNTIPDVMTGANGNNQKFVCCCCCKSGPLSASFHIQRRGFVPGDAITLYAEIENLSNRTMDKSYAEIIQYVQYHATTKTRTVARQVAVVSRPTIKPGKSDQWHGELLIIPPVPPSYLHGCKIIDITYFVRLNVDPAGPALDLEVPLEIVIGSIPHQSMLQQRQGLAVAPPPAQPPPPAAGFPSRDEIYGPYMVGAPLAPPPPVGAFPNMPPPTYSQSVFGKTSVADATDDGETQGDMSYAPVYTYYNWNT